MSRRLLRDSGVKSTELWLLSLRLLAEKHYTFCKHLCSGYQKMGLLSAKVGWWLLKLMYHKYEQNRRRLKKGLVVVVTGGSSGVGFDIVRVLSLHLPKIDSVEQHSVIFTSRTWAHGMV